jgi:hypothetical protein
LKGWETCGIEKLDVDVGVLVAIGEKMEAVDWRIRIG